MHCTYIKPLIVQGFDLFSVSWNTEFCYLPNILKPLLFSAVRFVMFLTLVSYGMDVPFSICSFPVWMFFPDATTKYMSLITRVDSVSHHSTAFPPPIQVLNDGHEANVNSGLRQAWMVLL